MKKRLIAVALAILLVLGGLGTFLIVRHVRNKRPPALDAIRERVELLVNASHEINEIYWGKGLPTYPRIYAARYPREFFYLTKNGDSYAFSETQTEIEMLYYTFTDAAVGDILAYQFCRKVGDGQYVDVEKGGSLTVAMVGRYRYAKVLTAPADGETPIFVRGGKYYYALPDYQEVEPEFTYTAADPEHYDYVRLDCKYGTIEELKDLAAEVYAKDFLNSVYESIFTGIAIGGTGGMLYARYMDYTDSEGRTYLMMLNTEKGVSVARTYLFETMRMSEKRKSNAKDVYVDIDTYVPGKEGEIMTITVALTLQDDGLWYLNSPTY
ncbi:MAG: hypothetical protein IJC99_01415 [Clostridia bacterium]|nr:hypothetical protein [Clostridia bacterium]